MHLRSGEGALSQWADDPVELTGLGARKAARDHIESELFVRMLRQIDHLASNAALLDEGRFEQPKRRTKSKPNVAFGRSAESGVAAADDSHFVKKDQTFKQEWESVMHCPKESSSDLTRSKAGNGLRSHVQTCTKVPQE